jgi:hypothetical protein
MRSALCVCLQQDVPSPADLIIAFASTRDLSDDKTGITVINYFSDNY